MRARLEPDNANGSEGQCRRRNPRSATNIEELGLRCCLCGHRSSRATCSIRATLVVQPVVLSRLELAGSQRALRHGKGWRRGDGVCPALDF
jgi:hypothetical protein